MLSWRERLALALVPKKSRALTINDAIRGQWAGIQTATGLRVDEKASLQIISVFTAVKILSSGFAQVPLKVYRSSPDGSRAEVREHPMYNLLHFRPNERMTAFGMREHWMMSLALWGNSYTQIIRNNRGDVESLWPLNPGAVKPERKPDGSIIYRVKLNADPFGFVSSGLDEVLREEEVLHIRGFTLDGLKGLSPIEMIRENVALSSAYQEFAARFFGNGGIPGFVLSTERPMQEPTVESIRKEWNENYQGLRNAQKVAILHSGTKVEKIGIPPEDMQFLESRQFEREEIFSFYRIPPNFYSANRITSWGSGIKEMSIGFVKFTLDPEFVRVEDALDSKFFGSPAQGPLFPEFDREGFLRGDFQTRIQGYKDLFNMGVVSNSWIARVENLPAPPTEVYVVPSNMVPVDKIDAIADQQAAPPPAPVAQPAKPEEPASQIDNAANRAALIYSQRNIFIEAVDRIIRRAAFDIGQAKQRKSGETDEDAHSRFGKWMTKFTADHLGFAADKLATAFEGLAELIRADVSRETSRDVVPFPNFVRLKLEQAAANLATETDGEAATIVDGELLELANAFAEVAYQQAGVVTTESVAIDGHPLLIGRRFVGRTRTTADSITINNNNYQPPVNVPITVEPAAPAQVNVQQAAQEPPTVNIENKVEMPAQPAPVVNIEQAAQEPPIINLGDNVVHVPEQPPAKVEVNIEQAAQEPPIINLPKAEIPVQQPPVVNVTVSPTPVTVRNEVKTPEVHIDNKVETAPAGDITLEYDEQKGRVKSLKRKKS